MRASREALAALGFEGSDPHPPAASAKRFGDGAQFRIEIPSTESPAAFRAILEQASARDVPVHRISQGSAAEPGEAARRIGARSAKTPCGRRDGL